MSDKLIIPKTILQGIANAIRGKTGDGNPIKVKDMPTAIANIPGPQPKPPSLKLDTETSLNMILGSPDMLKANLRCFAVDEGISFNTSLQNASLKLYKINDDVEQYVKSEWTNSEGICNFEITDPNYDKLRVHFEGSEIFKEFSQEYVPVKLEVTYHNNSEDYWRAFWVSPGGIHFDGVCYFQWEDEPPEIYDPNKAIDIENLEKDKEYTFSFMGNITGVDPKLFTPTTITEITLPESMIDIEEYPSLANSWIKTIKLPENINGVPGLYDCIYLETLDLPNNITEIKRAEIEEEGETIIKGCFEGCTSLTHVGMSDKVTNFDVKTFKGCTGFGKTFKFPSKLEHIREGCFLECNNLLYLELPHTLRTVGFGSNTETYQDEWISSSSLKYMYIPEKICSEFDYDDPDDSVNQVPPYFFGKGSPVEYLVIPESVKDYKSYSGLMENAFKELPNLKTITCRNLESPCVSASAYDTWEKFFDDYFEDYDREITIYLPEGYDDSWNDFFKLNSSEEGRWNVITYTPYEDPVYIWDVNKNYESTMGDYLIILFTKNEAGEWEEYTTCEYNPDEHCYVGENVIDGEYKFSVYGGEEEPIHERIVEIDQSHENIFYFEGLVDLL